MYNFSPNMLKTYQMCSQKYYLQYVKKIKVPQLASNFEKGKKIHALANYYLRGDDISKLEKALNPDEKLVWDKLLSNEYFQKKYVNSEYNLLCKVGEFWVGGRLDAVVKDDKKYYILDYKTGSIPKNPEYDFQTIVYLLCLSKKLKNGYNLDFIYIDLKNNINKIIEFDEQKEKEYEKILSDVCKSIKIFEPQEEIEYTKKCEFCEYRKICKSFVNLNQ